MKNSPIKFTQMLTTLLVLSVWNKAIAQPSPVTPMVTQGHELSVTGTGSVEAVPDAFTLTVTLEERGPVVAKLHSSMTSRLSQIIEFLLEHGIEQQHIQSMGVNVYPWYDNRTNDNRQKGVVLSRQVTITSQNIEEYDRVLDGLFTRGVERLDRFHFTHSNDYELHNQAILNAIDDAKAKAELMANRLNQRITGVTNISHQNYAAPRTANPSIMAAERMNTALPGTMGFHGAVQVTFSIEAK